MEFLTRGKKLTFWGSGGSRFTLSSSGMSKIEHSSKIQTILKTIYFINKLKQFLFHNKNNHRFLTTRHSFSCALCNRLTVLHPHTINQKNPKMTQTILSM